MTADMSNAARNELAASLASRLVDDVMDAIEDVESETPGFRAVAQVEPTGRPTIVISMFFGGDPMKFLRVEPGIPYTTIRRYIVDAVIAERDAAEAAGNFVFPSPNGV